ncbi:hypothetical protein BVRB_7g173910 [Beta vulgaris subsp. vulgaris]|nr:hypothetical protein BVRB_7g173910 [Beta vulgaris subsp. vulgaris]
MGKHLWRKHSYVRVEDDHPGCIWTVFRMLDYHPWDNFRKNLPYNKHEKSTKSKGIKPEEEHSTSKTLELQEDSIIKYSASVNSSSTRNGSTSKRSIKARIRAFMKEKDNSTNPDFLIQESEFQSHENYNVDDSAPTLMSLLKANPKLIKSITKVEDSSNMKHGTNLKHKDSKKEDDFVGVLELFRVDQDLFVKFLQDSPPRRKPRLVKSGTFPSRSPSNFGTTPPSKVEHKHNEVWPISSNGRGLQKAKSQGFIRSSSLTESLEKYGYLFDSTSTKAIKKHLSKSFRLMNEKEYVLLNDLHGRRSSKERLDFSESESNSFTMSDDPSRASLERWNNTIRGEGPGLRLDSPRKFLSFSESQSDEKENSFIVEQRRSFETTSDEANDGVTSTSVLEVRSQTNEIENMDCLIMEESSLVSMRTHTLSENIEYTQHLDDQFLVDNYNEELQYVKYVLDIIGITTAAAYQRETWHSQNQPLDPALFDGIEVCCPFEPKSSNKDVAVFVSESHRKILFDLINEALIDIDERSNVYYPKALSYWCHICPKTNEKNHIVVDVWEFVEKLLNWKPELDPSLDLAMSHDLSNDKNGWVNLQMDTEGLGLDLEDLIFNEILDEIVCY